MAIQSWWPKVKYQPKHITGSLLCAPIHFCKRVTHLDEFQAALRRTILEGRINRQYRGQL
jgi:hypothetical protein